jgi:hypothetical protein
MAAHRLQGLVSNFDAHEAARSAQSLEAMGRDNRLAEAGATCDEIEFQLAHLHQAVEGFIALFPCGGVEDVR